MTTTSSYPTRIRASFITLLLAFAAVVSAYGQAFLAEWNAASNGGIGPTGLVLATESGTTYLYASDHPRGRVIKFNPATGAVVAVFGQQGTANGEFNQPYGLARDPATGHLYVAERGNNRISRITNTGTFVMSWGTMGTATGQFNAPIGVAVDSTGDVYVTDHGNNRVQKFRVAQTGGVWAATLLTSWGSSGSANGQFNQPYGITADSAGNIWVADGFNGRVQKFNSSGVFQSVLGSAGSGPGQFIVATWVGLHPGGDLLVTSTNSNPQDGTLADASNQWVSRFTSAGAFVSRFGGAFGGGPSQFRLPFSAVVDAANRAYVSDYYNSRIQVFDLNTAPGTGGTDTTAPTVASFTLGSTTATTVNFQIMFSEAVTGVDATDFTAVTSGAATATIGTVTGSGASYTIPVTFAGTGGVQLNLKTSGTGITDAATNAIATGATGPVYTIPSPGSPDIVPPTVATFTVGTTTATSVTFNLVFSEPVTGLDASDFTAVTSGTAVATIGAVGGTGTTYTIPVTFTGTGGVQLNLKTTGTGITDAAANAIATGAVGPSYTIPTSGGGTDTVPPTVVTFAVGASSPTSVTFNLVFSEAVTGVNAADFTAVTTGGPTTTIGAVTGSGATYSVPVTFTGTGTIRLNLNATGTGITDTATNAIVGGAMSAIFTIGTPTGGVANGTRVVSVTAPANGTYAKGQDLLVTVKFNARVRVIADDDDDDDDDRDDRGNNGNGRGQGNSGRNGDDDDDDDDSDGDVPYITWNSVVSTGQTSSSGKIHYVSGSGTDTLTFRYNIKKDDVARNGIALGLSILLPGSTEIRDATTNAVLPTANLALPWAQNPIPGVIIGSNVSPLSGKKSQVIVLKPTGRVPVGESITLDATTSSGLPITWQLVSGNATLVGNVLTPKNKGAIVLRATQGGNTNFESASIFLDLEAKEKRDDRLVNLSSRIRVTGGDASRTVVAGFVVSGTTTREFLVRAIGPGLASFNIAERLNQLKLELRDSTGRLVSENEGWASNAEMRAAFERVGAFPLTNGSRDAAMLVPLAPGGYTAQVSANGNGITLIEVYDASTGLKIETEQLVNISTRGFVEAGEDNMLMAGFVVTGSTPKRVLIRGIGPGLTRFDVPNILTDPVLRLFSGPNSTVVIAQNDDWGTAQNALPAHPPATSADITAAATATGAFPLTVGSKDASIVVTLPPGNYSAAVTGANGGTGAALVEVYEIPTP